MSYTGFLNDHLSTSDKVTDVQERAVAVAQEVEIESFQLLNLSVQELVDCDSAADQGCTGGNPLLAFYFIHRYGLTSWERYPYVGIEDTCQKQRVRHPVASVKSWGVVSPNHEKHMKLTLRFVGPIAVGINGADPSFLAYSGGIFDKAKCKQAANHALLIVGYGQEEFYDGTVTNYWIARNSWGRGWGENGFVRIARGHGSKGIPGVCGIARSPSVALGGFLIEREGISSFAAHSGNGEGAVEELEYTTLENTCIFLRLQLDGGCGHFALWIDSHHALVAGLVGVCLGFLAIWPLSRDWRKRRRLRRLREERRQKNALGQENGEEKNRSSPLLSAEGGQENGEEQNESSPLLSADDDKSSYGANAKERTISSA
jgi:hypothetical protein